MVNSCPLLGVKGLIQGHTVLGGIVWTAAGKRGRDLVSPSGIDPPWNVVFT